jgi:hypothetical protein
LLADDTISSRVLFSGFIFWFFLYSTSNENDGLVYIKEKAICNDGYGCDCEKLHVVTIIAIGWTRGNKKALATILPFNYWEKLRTLSKFDYSDIAAVSVYSDRDRQGIDRHIAILIAGEY